MYLFAFVIECQNNIDVYIPIGIYSCLLFVGNGVFLPSQVPLDGLRERQHVQRLFLRLNGAAEVAEGMLGLKPPRLGIVKGRAPGYMTYVLFYFLYGLADGAFPLSEVGTD